MNQRSHEQALGDLKTLILQGTSLTLITGSTQLQRQSLLADVLQQQSQSQPILQIHDHHTIDPQTLNTYFSQQWRDINRLPNMSLEQQLQATLDHLNTHQASCIAIADNAQQLPFSVLAAFAHLAMQQTNKPTTCMHIILLGDQKLYHKMRQFIKEEHLQHIELTEKTSTTTPGAIDATVTHARLTTADANNQTTSTATARPPTYANTSAHHDTITRRSIWQQHGTRITAWFLLVLLCVGLWEYSHHQPTRGPAPLIPVKKQIAQTTPTDNPFQAQPTSAAHATTQPSSPVTKQHINTPTQAATQSSPSPMIAQTPAAPTQATVTPTAQTPTTPIHANTQPVAAPHTQYTLQFASSHDKHALSQLQQQLNIPGSHINEVMQKNTVHFVLLAGQYPSINAAKSAEKQLPQQAQQQHPWVRSVESFTPPKQTNS